jgi:hypothetical protein|tara:strand:- start:2113 stop:2253 length:141 start_codon:yes stop_codon:yes gene_type:complete
MGHAAHGKGPPEGDGCPAKTAGSARNIECEPSAVKIKPMKLLPFFG